MLGRGLAVVCASVMLAACGEKTGPAAREPLEVVTVDVKTQDVPIYTDFVGSVDGMVNAEIRARTAGYIESVNYKEGANVKAGDVLFKIDPVLAKAAETAAAGQVATARAMVSKSTIEYERNKTMVAQGAVTRQEMDNATASLQLAQAQLITMQGALDNARANLGYTTVTSPIDGVAGLAKVRIGNLVGQGEPTLLTTVSQLDPVRVAFTISEQLYLKKAMELRTLQDTDRKMEDGRLELLLADGSKYPHKGILATVDRQIDATTGTITLQAYFPNPDLLLRPGQFAKVRAPIALKKDAIAVPQRAIREMQGVYQLGVVGADNKVDVRSVTVGERVGSLWVIEKGLASGDKVIVEGLMKCKPGDVVKTKPLAAAEEKVPAPESAPRAPAPEAK